MLSILTLTNIQSATLTYTLAVNHLVARQAHAFVLLRNGSIQTDHMISRADGGLG